MLPIASWAQRATGVIYTSGPPVPSWKARIGLAASTSTVDTTIQATENTNTPRIPINTLAGPASAAPRGNRLTVAGPPGTARRPTDAMECLFPGSSTTPRRFSIDRTELAPGSATTVCGVTVSASQGGHPSGAPALLIRLGLAGKTIAYTGAPPGPTALFTPPLAGGPASPVPDRC
jgi:hypothetical protein